MSLDEGALKRFTLDGDEDVKPLIDMVLMSTMTQRPWWRQLARMVHEDVGSTISGHAGIAEWQHIDIFHLRNHHQYYLYQEY